MADSSDDESVIDEEAVAHAVNMELADEYLALCVPSLLWLAEADVLTVRPPACPDSAANHYAIALEELAGVESRSERARRSRAWAVKALANVAHSEDRPSDLVLHMAFAKHCRGDRLTEKASAFIALWEVID